MTGRPRNWSSRSTGRSTHWPSTELEPARLLQSRRSLRRSVQRRDRMLRRRQSRRTWQLLSRRLRGGIGRSSRIAAVAARITEVGATSPAPSVALALAMAVPPPAADASVIAWRRPRCRQLGYIRHSRRCLRSRSRMMTLRPNRGPSRCYPRSRCHPCRVCHARSLRPRRRSLAPRNWRRRSLSTWLGYLR